MSYSVTYGQDFFAQPKVRKRKTVRNISVFVLTLLLAAALLGVSKIRTTVRNFLLPGNGEVTADAVESFAGNMKSGMPFEDAAEVFCQQILQNG